MSNTSMLCPSSRPDTPDSMVFGIIGGTVTDPRIAYLKEPQPVTEELIARAAPVTPTEIFRTASACAESKCLHFDGQGCHLAMRIVEKLPVVAENLPPCAIRRDCRWWQQEGKAACMRCPQVITDNYNAPGKMREVGHQVNLDSQLG
jgi:hypothetical protein